MTVWRHRLRRARFIAGALVAIVVIGLAVAIGLMQLLLPLATHYPDFVARQLSARLHRPVAFAAIDSEWQPSGPLLVVRDLTLGPELPGGAPITLPHAAVKFDFGAWLLPAHRWITLRLTGMNLRVEHGAAGWRIAGFASTAGSTRAALQSLPVDLDLHDLQVDIVDVPTARSWHLRAPRLEVVNTGAGVRFGGAVSESGTRQGVRVAGRMDADSRDYELYVSTRGLDLAEAASGVGLDGYGVKSGHGDIELWGSWRGGRLANATVRYDVKGVKVETPDDRVVGLTSFAGLLRVERRGRGWALAWHGPGDPDASPDAVGGAAALLTGGPGAWHVSAAARAMDAAPWLSILAMAPQAPESLADWVGEAKPGVTVDAAAFVWRQGGAWEVNARFSSLHAAATGAVPGGALVRGVIRGDNEAVSLELPAQAATLALTDVFRKPFEFKSFAGRFVAWRERGQWHAATHGLHFDNVSFAGNAAATVVWRGAGHRPFVSAYATVDRAKVVDAKQFWPWHSMSPTLVAWLDHALVSGDVTAGRVVLRGDLDDWPFVDDLGRFEAVATVKDAAFDFADTWPRATGVDARVAFVDNGMHIVASRVKVRDVTVRHAEAAIADFHHGVLGLEIEGTGSGAALLDFVRHSPVGADAKDALEGISMGGTGQFGVQLSLPLGEPRKFSLAGKLDLANADIQADKWKLELKDVTGPLVIAGHGFHTDALKAMFRGAPATLSMAVGDNVANPVHVVEASLETRASLQTLAQGYPDVYGLVAHASGVAPFHIGVEVTAARDGVPAVPVLTVKSSLQGVALNFPAPLAKTANTRLPFELNLKLPPEGAPLSVSLGDVLQVRGRLADAAHGTPTALAVAFGATRPASVPPSGLVVGGHAAHLDISGWIQLALPGTSRSDFPSLTHAHVTTDLASVFDANLGALEFEYSADPDHDTITLAGPAVKGSLRFPTSNLMARGITADLERLYWPSAPAPEKPESNQRPPVASPIPPMLVPPMHVAIGDLRLGKAHLGAIVFESAPSLTGMRVEKFEARAPEFSMKMHGNWDGGALYSQSHFVIDLNTQDFGKALAAFGFDGALAGGDDSRVHIDASWEGPPSSFSLGWMTGSLSLDVGEGRILAVKPGFGRMLGLLSVRELPSRLTLHFGDVFKSGFGFDHASGTFDLNNGSAYTQDMLIDAPAAKIAMRGRIGFRSHDYDIIVAVTPHVGSTLPIVGAVLGGPVGAAAGLVVQGLIGKGINRAAGSVYQVTGSWDEPKISELSSMPAPAASALPAASVATPASTAMPAPATSAGPAPPLATAPAIGPPPATSATTSG